MQERKPGKLHYLFDESGIPSLDSKLSKQAILDLLNNYGGEIVTRQTSTRDDVARVEFDYQGETPGEIE